MSWTDARQALDETEPTQDDSQGTTVVSRALGDNSQPSGPLRLRCSLDTCHGQHHKAVAGLARLERLQQKPLCARSCVRYLRSEPLAWIGWSPRMTRDSWMLHSLSLVADSPGPAAASTGLVRRSFCVVHRSSTDAPSRLTLSRPSTLLPAMAADRGETVGSCWPMAGRSGWMAVGLIQPVVPWRLVLHYVPFRFSDNSARSAPHTFRPVDKAALCGPQGERLDVPAPSRTLRSRLKHGGVYAPGTGCRVQGSRKRQSVAVLQPNEGLLWLMAR